MALPFFPVQLVPALRACLNTRERGQRRMQSLPTFAEKSVQFDSSAYALFSAVFCGLPPPYPLYLSWRFVDSSVLYAISAFSVCFRVPVSVFEYPQCHGSPGRLYCVSDIYTITAGLFITRSVPLQPSRGNSAEKNGRDCKLAIIVRAAGNCRSRKMEEIRIDRDSLLIVLRDLAFHFSGISLPGLVYLGNFTRPPKASLINPSVQQSVYGCDFPLRPPSRGCQFPCTHSLIISSSTLKQPLSGKFNSFSWAQVIYWKIYVIVTTRQRARTVSSSDIQPWNFNASIHLEMIL